MILYKQMESLLQKSTSSLKDRNFDVISNLGITYR